MGTARDISSCLGTGVGGWRVTTNEVEVGKKVIQTVMVIQLHKSMFGGYILKHVLKCASGLDLES